MSTQEPAGRQDIIKFLHDTGCSLDGSETVKTGKLGRVMTVWARSVSSNDLDSAARASNKRPKGNYCPARTEEDPFPNLSLLDPIEKDQHEGIRTAVEEMEMLQKNKVWRMLKSPNSRAYFETIGHLMYFILVQSGGKTPATENQPHTRRQARQGATAEILAGSTGLHK